MQGGGGKGECRKQDGGITKKHRKPFGGDWNISYLDCGDSFTSVKYVKTYQTAHFKYVHFIVWQIFLIKHCFLNSQNYYNIKRIKLWGTKWEKKSETDRTDKSGISRMLKELPINEDKNRIAQLKMGKISEQIFYERGYPTCCWRCETIRTLIHCWWACKLVQLLWKSIWHYLLKFIIGYFIIQKFSPGFMAKRMHIYVYQKTCKRMLISPLFVLAPNWKQPSGCQV